jgi:histidyl-tRNA synthetase
MSKVPVLPPSGFRDFLPEEASARAALIETITKIYQARGFQPIGMSMLEALSTLQGKGGGTDNEKLIFKVLRRGEDLQRALDAGEGQLADMGLRFDLTLPLARYCSRFREQLPKPFKVFQIGPVWRADRPQKGRFREFYQCDVDIVGAKEIGAEADCIGAILEVFAALGIEGVEAHVNDRRLLAALRGELSEKDWAEALITLDKLDKVGPEGVEKELKEKLGSVPAGVARILKGGGLEDFASVDAESAASIGTLLELLGASSQAKSLFNPTLVRGQDYYTGTIFELRHPNLSGSLAGGGRYNRLLQVFGGPETPAFGGSIGFERLFLLLQESDRAAGLSQPPDLFFPLFDASLRAPVLALAKALRVAGLWVDVFPDAAKLKNQFKYADDRGIPFTAILGQDELAKKEIKVKSMRDRSEETFSTDPLDNFVKRMTALCRP